MIGKLLIGAVTFDIVKVNDNLRRHIFSDDGADYICTEVTIDLTAVLNPSATSYADVVNSVPQQGNAFAGRTDRILSDYLSQPRRTVKMWAYDADGSRRTYLESPTPGLPCDVRNGPKVTVFAISGADVHGAKTWIAHLVVQTWINNCLDGTSPVLSNRWERTVSYDSSYRAISTTRGRAVFHAGRMRKENVFPDNFREQFFQPVPEFMAREMVNVTADSDGCTLDYTVVDSERFASVGSDSQAVNVEASLQTWHTQGSVVAAVAQTAPVLWAAAADTLANPGSPLANIRRGAGVLESFAGNLQSNLPRYYTNIRVRAHGARNSPRSSLANLCFAIAFSRLGPPSFFDLANRSEMVMAQSLGDDNWVDFSFTMHWMDQIFTQLAGAVGPPGAIAASIALLMANDNGRRFMNAYFPVQNLADDPTGNNTYERPPPPPIAQNVAGELIREAAVGLANFRAAVTHPAGFPAGRPLLSNKAIGNHPMNNESPLAKNNRGIGYMKILLTQVLMGQCPNIAALPGDWDKPTIGGYPSVPPIDVPLLPQS